MLLMGIPSLSELIIPHLGSPDPVSFVYDVA